MSLFKEGGQFVNRGPVLDTGGYHRGFKERGRFDRITVFLPTNGNLAREEAMIMAIKELGLPMGIKRVRPPDPEIGNTSAERALYKTEYVIEKVFLDGYLNRHPAELALIAASDSRDIYQGQAFDKPSSVHQMASFAEHHERVRRQEERLFVDVGYALSVMSGPHFATTTITDRLELVHLCEENLEGRLLREGLERAQKYAHGLGTKELILDGQTKVIDVLTGASVAPEIGWRRVNGAWLVVYKSLLASALAQFKS